MPVEQFPVDISQFFYLRKRIMRLPLEEEVCQAMFFKCMTKTIINPVLQLINKLILTYFSKIPTPGSSTTMNPSLLRSTKVFLFTNLCFQWPEYESSFEI